MKCPICNSKKLTSKNQKKESCIADGNKFSYTEKVYSCKSCDFLGAIDNKSRSSYEKNKKLAIKKSIKNLVTDLNKKFPNLLYIERIFDLPRKALKKWKKSGDESNSTLLLLKMIETYPFLISVAESKFDKEIAVKALTEASKAYKHHSSK